MRSTAYADFLRGFAKAAKAQNDSLRDEASKTEEREGSVIVADSRARIAMYAGKDVVRALAKFISLGTQTHSAEGMQAFAELVMAMRSESGMEKATFDEATRLLFS